VRLQSFDALTNALRFVTLGNMALRLQRLDPERRRKRLALLAERSGAKTVRESFDPRRVQADRIRELIATRRRLAG
jgi:hypothetical protein